VSKRSAAIIILAALVVGVVLGITWHEPKGMALPDDIRAWIGFIVVIVGAGVALWQLDMQRRQLADQKEVFKGEIERNKQRDALMAGQLLELEQRSMTFERQQAEAIGFRQSSLMAKVPGSDPSASHRVHQAEIENDSRRPVRDVACRIESEPGDSLQPTAQAGFWVEAAGVGNVRFSAPSFLGLSEGTNIPLVRVGETAVFAFAVDTSEHPKARVTARFTDDTGLHWQIDPDLHLEKLDNRDDW
jgi:hypothetical protein